MFLWPVRVYYEDTDSGGVVYYANYLRFLERARTELLRRYGFEQDTLALESGLVFVVRSLNIDYLKPACFNDCLLISAQVEAHAGASLQFSQQVWRDDPGRDMRDACLSDQAVLCRAAVKVVCLDRTTLRPRRLPNAMKEIWA